MKAKEVEEIARRLSDTYKGEKNKRSIRLTKSAMFNQLHRIDNQAEDSKEGLRTATQPINRMIWIVILIDIIILATLVKRTP